MDRITRAGLSSATNPILRPEIVAIRPNNIPRAGTRLSRRLKLWRQMPGLVGQCYRTQILRILHLSSNKPRRYPTLYLGIYTLVVIVGAQASSNHHGRDGAVKLVPYNRRSILRLATSCHT